MKPEYIKPFTEASRSIIHQVTGFEPNIGEAYIKEIPYTGDTVVVLIGLTGQLYGSAIITLSKSFACKIASIMMGGMPVPELDEIAKSAIAELCNMILGNAASNFYKNNISIDITPPTVFTGENMQVSPTKAETICIPHVFEDGETLEIDLIYKEK